MTAVLTVFRVLASCTSIVMLLSPLPSIIHIARTKSTGVASIVPLVAMFTNSHIVMMFGYLSKQYFPVFSTFAVGDIITLSYIAIFYTYTHERSKAHRVFLLFGTVVVVATAYALLGGFGVTGQSRHAVGLILGYCTILTAAVFYTSPMERIGHVLRHKSAAFFNVQMLCAGTLNNAMWVAYSAQVQQWIIFAPNAFCCFMGVVQIALYWIFHPSTHPLQAPDAKEIELDELEAGVYGGVLSPKASGSEFVLVASPLAPLHHHQQQTKEP